MDIHISLMPAIVIGGIILAVVIILICTVFVCVIREVREDTSRLIEPLHEDRLIV
jgi:hypothetical protein